MNLTTPKENQYSLSSKTLQISSKLNLSNHHKIIMNNSTKIIKQDLMSIL